MQSAARGYAEDSGCFSHFRESGHTTLQQVRAEGALCRLPSHHRRKSLINFMSPYFAIDHPLSFGCRGALSEICNTKLADLHWWLSWIWLSGMTLTPDSEMKTARIDVILDCGPYVSEKPGASWGSDWGMI